MTRGNLFPTKKPRQDGLQRQRTGKARELYVSQDNIEYITPIATIYLQDDSFLSNELDLTNLYMLEV